MSLLRVLVLGFGLVAVSAAAADDDKKPGKLDADKLVGAWKITAGMKAGEKVDEKALKAAVSFTKDKITLKDEQGMEFEFSYKLDAATDPVGIDMGITKPEAFKDAKAQGIIELKDGTLKLCYHPEGKERPKKFESTKDNGFYYFTLKKGERPATKAGDGQ